MGYVGESARKSTKSVIYLTIGTYCLSFGIFPVQSLDLHFQHRLLSDLHYCFILKLGYLLLTNTSRVGLLN